MKPVVTIVYSCDESLLKEHIYPRATLMSTLSKVMRGDTGIVFCTGLAAFFAIKEECHTRKGLAAFFKKQKDQPFTCEDVFLPFPGA
jgi:hypothetical protein